MPGILEHQSDKEVIPARQDEHETLETLFKNVDLSFAYNLIKQCFHANGPGRPPRNPSCLARVKELSKTAKKVYGYFNNHCHGYAPENCP